MIFQAPLPRHNEFWIGEPKFSSLLAGSLDGNRTGLCTHICHPVSLSALLSIRPLNTLAGRTGSTKPKGLVVCVVGPQCLLICVVGQSDEKIIFGI